jgi:hypothetical protein
MDGCCMLLNQGKDFLLFKHQARRHLNTTAEDYSRRNSVDHVMLRQGRLGHLLRSRQSTVCGEMHSSSYIIELFLAVINAYQSHK